MKISFEENKREESPIMRQYNDLKRKHPDAILLIGVGDFYNSYEDDAEKISGILGITLTRSNSSKKSYRQVAGFPQHALDIFLPKIIRSGYRVAICDQLEPAEKLEKRAVDLTPKSHTLSRKFLEEFCDMYDRFVADCTKEERDKHRDSISEVKGLLHARIGGAV